MSEEPSSAAVAPEELKRQINSLATDIVDAIDVLTRDLQRSLLSLADRVEQRMEAMRMGAVKGPIVNDIQEGVKSEAKRFSESARTKIQEITQKKSQLAGLGDELSALAAMTASEREALRARLQQEIAASAKTRQELEVELAEAKVKLADLEKRMNSQSTRDARRIDKLQAANQKLEAQVKRLEADLLQLNESADKIKGDRDAALKRLKELEAALEAARKRTDSLTSAEGKARTDADTLTKKLEQSQLAQQKAAQELSSAKQQIQQLEEQTRRLQESLSTAEKQAQKTSRIPELEKQLQELTSLKVSNQKQIADLENKLAAAEKELEELKGKEAKLSRVGTERDTLSKEKAQLEKQLADVQAKLEKMREDYAKFETVKNRLQFLEARSHVQDILLQKDQHYIVLTTLANKIVEGKYSCTAKELGYSPTVGISLAAWLDKFFLDLEQEGLVVLQRKAGGGLPSATIEATEKGRSLFEEAKQRAAL
jgi:chromosome segregation ATPase